MKKLLVGILVLAMTFSLLACGSASTEEGSSSDATSSEDAAPAGDTMKIGMACINLSDSGLVLIKKGADLAAEDYNCELIWKACEGSIDTQIDQIRGFVQEGCDAIWIDSCDAEAIIDVVNEAVDSGVRVYTAGSKVEATGNYNLIYPDYNDSYFAGTVIGKWYEDAEGTIGLIAATAGSRLSEDRRKGFTDAISQYPSLKLATGLGEWDANKSMTVAEDLCRSNPDLIHMHVIAAGMSFGAFEGIKNVQGGENITISTNDADPEALLRLEDGSNYILDNVVGNERLGYWGVAIMRKGFDGAEMALDQFLPTYKVAGEEMLKFIEDNGFTEINGVKYDIVTIDEAREIVDSSFYREEFNEDFMPNK